MDQRLYIDFVRPSASQDQLAEHVPTSPPEPRGDAIKQFYEELVQTDFNKGSSGSSTHQNRNSSRSRTQQQDSTGSKQVCSLARRASRKTRNETDEDFGGCKEVKTENNLFDNDSDIRISTDVKSDQVYEGASDSFEDMHRLHLDLLNFAQNGNLSDMKRLLQNSRVDVNFQDQYGWTALMCAAMGRHLEIVKHLLENGADKYIQNRNRQTVLEMCGEVFEEIFKQQQLCERKHKKKQKLKSSFYCDLCKSEFSDTTLKKHQASTLHIFNTGVKPKADQFMITESNIGFQLMQKSGWDGESGLGTGAQGQKYPVKTTLKRDRKGLGIEDKSIKKPKVTHFGPNDKEAIQSVYKGSDRVVSARTSSRRERNKKVQKDKKWERELRMYMNLP